MKTSNASSRLQSTTSSTTNQNKNSKPTTGSPRPQRNYQNSLSTISTTHRNLFSISRSISPSYTNTNKNEKSSSTIDSKSYLTCRIHNLRISLRKEITARTILPKVGLSISPGSVFRGISNGKMMTPKDSKDTKGSIFWMILILVKCRPGMSMKSLSLLTVWETIYPNISGLPK